MPNFPSYLYYTSPGKPIYRLNPPGKLDITRFINGQPYWRTPHFEKTVTPKKIILMDWQIGFYDQYKRKALNVVLKNLIQEGFSLYIWSNKKVKPLTAQLLSDLEDGRSHTTWSITPDYHDKIIEKAIQSHYFTRDQVMLLDDYIVDQLLNPELAIDRPRILKVSPLEFEKNGQEVININSKVYPPVSGITVDEFRTKNQRLENEAKKLQKEFSSLKIDYEYQSVTISSDDVAKQLLNTTPSSILQNVSSLEIYGDVSVGYIEKLLEAMPKLHKLRLWSIHLTKDKLHFQKPILTQLKEVEIQYSSVSIKNVNTLLGDALPDSIKFRNTTLDNDSIQLTDEQIKHLESISIEDTTINHVNLNRLLQASNLAYLRLNCVKDKDKVILQPLHHLETFSGKILPQLTYDNLNQFFPKLKNLTIYYDDNKESAKSCSFFQEEKIPSQNHLEKIRINEKINNNQLSGILSAAPNVRKIDLSEPILTESNIDAAHSLPKLEKIYIYTGEVHIKLMQKLFALAPNLKNVELPYTKISHESKDEAIMLKSLKEMDLDHCSLTQDQLNILLASAAQSKKLNLRYKSQESILQLKKDYPGLKRLKYIKISLLSS